MKEFSTKTSGGRENVFRNNCYDRLFFPTELMGATQNLPKVSKRAKEFKNISKCGKISRKLDSFTDTLV